MTNREFFSAIASNRSLSAEIIEFATEAIAKLDKRNAERSSKPSKVAIANEPLKTQILELIDENGMTASEIAEKMNISVQKASNLCLTLVQEGRLVSSEIKVPKKGKCKLYKIVGVEDGEEDGE